jgi:DNA-binding CsgD family transcriptional regulator
MAARVAQGVQALLRGAPDQAVDHLLAAGQDCDRAGWVNPHWLPWRPAAVQALIALGRTGEAVILVEHEHADALSWGTPTLIGRCLGLLAALAGPEDAAQLWQQAAAVLASSPDLAARARAEAEVGRLLEAASSPGAEEALTPPPRPASGHEQPQAPGTVRPPAEDAAEHPLPARPAALTRSEEAVVERIRLGWTNQQIADALGISRRAVEKNLTRAYRKFGVRGRNELLTALDA